MKKKERKVTKSQEWIEALLRYTCRGAEVLQEA